MKKILIIEDDQKVAKALEIRIRTAGYATAVAGDGQDGVTEVARSRPDLVLLDINLPGANGFTVAQRIQAMGSSPLPIIFITASKKPELFARARQLGGSVAGFIEKPYDPVQVLDLLGKVLEAAG